MDIASPLRGEQFRLALANWFAHQRQFRTKTEFARALRMKPATVSNWFAGRYQPYSELVWLKLEKVTGLPLYSAKRVPEIKPFVEWCVTWLDSHPEANIKHLAAYLGVTLIALEAYIAGRYFPNAPTGASLFAKTGLSIFSPAAYVERSAHRQASGFRSDWARTLFITLASHAARVPAQLRYRVYHLLLFIRRILQAAERSGVETTTGLTREKLKSLKPRNFTPRMTRLSKKAFDRLMVQAGIWAAESQRITKKRKQQPQRNLRRRNDYLPFVEQANLLSLPEPDYSPESLLWLELVLKCGLRVHEIRRIHYGDIDTEGILLPTGQKALFGNSFHQVSSKKLERYLRSHSEPWEPSDFLFYQHKPRSKSHPISDLTIQANLRTLPGKHPSEVLRRSHFFTDFVAARNNTEFVFHLKKYHGFNFQRARDYSRLYARFVSLFRVPAELAVIAPCISLIEELSHHPQWWRGGKGVTLQWEKSNWRITLKLSKSAYDYISTHRYQTLKLIYVLAAYRTRADRNVLKRVLRFDRNQILRPVYGDDAKKFVPRLDAVVRSLRTAVIRLYDRDSKVAWEGRVIIMWKRNRSFRVPLFDFLDGPSRDSGCLVCKSPDVEAVDAALLKQGVMKASAKGIAASYGVPYWSLRQHTGCMGRHPSPHFRTSFPVVWLDQRLLQMDADKHWMSFVAYPLAALLAARNGVRREGLDNLIEMGTVGDEIDRLSRELRYLRARGLLAPGPEPESFLVQLSGEARARSNLLADSPLPR